ncbi:flagellar motor switch protein FliG [Microbacteriaceae bacterium 4G12]
MAEVNIEKVTSKEKAAILIQVLDEDVAAQVIDLMTTDEKETLIREIARFRMYSPEILEAVLDQFLQEFSLKELAMSAPDKSYIKRIFKNMSDEEWASMMYDAYLSDDNPFDFLNSLNDLEPLLTILNDESPQTIAIVASYIKPQLASALVEKLPEHKMVETVMRIAKLEQVDSELIGQIGDVLRIKLNTISFSAMNKTDGIKTIVNILNNVSRGIEKTVFDKLDQMDYELSEKIRENMFVFEDLLRLDGLALRRLMEEIKDNVLIAKALKSAKEEIKEKIFTSMSSSRKDMILEEVDGLGPIKVADAEKAQQVITSTVKKMEKEGKIVIQRGEEDVLI